MATIKFDSDFEKMVQKRALELFLAGEKSGTLNNVLLGTLKVFIGNEPKSFIAVFNSTAPELLGEKIFVGTNL